jgi:hypothetical protein
MKLIVILISICCFVEKGFTQEVIQADKSNDNHKFSMSGNLGLSFAYADKRSLISPTTSVSTSFHLKKGYYLEFAPRYTWICKWNEHYLTLPIHLKKQVNKRVSLFAGPAITWDVGYFRDFGISAGADLYIGENSSIKLSFFTFTLYDYYIDYLYVPVGISYSYRFIKK